MGSLVQAAAEDAKFPPPPGPGLAASFQWEIRVC